MKYLIQWARWLVPSEDRAFEGKLEGRVTPAERAERYAEVARLRKNWKPCPEAWSQLQDLEQFIEHRIRVQFWDPIMYMLEDEGPYPLHADCQGIALLRQEQFLQAYLMLARIEILPTSRGCSPERFLERKSELECTLAPIAEVLEVETFTERL